MQRSLVGYLYVVTVQLFAMAKHGSGSREALRIPRQKTFERRMTFAQDTFMNQFKNGDIAPDSGRSEIEVQKGLLRREVEFSEESVLGMLEFLY
jgi:hypothetical protein